MKKAFLIIITMIIWLVLNLISLAYFGTFIILTTLILSIVIEIGLIEEILHMDDFKTKSLFNNK